MKSLADHLLKRIPDGMVYRDAAQLCQRLATNLAGVPEELHPKTSADLADTFVELTKLGWVRDTEAPFRALYGAHYHDITDRGHWIEVMACVFKHPDRVDKVRGEKLAAQVGFAKA